MNWTPGKIENYKQASDYASFHKKLAILAEPYLDSEWTMADIGCGPGLLALQLAPMVCSVDAIDNDRVAIEDLKKNLDDVATRDRRTAEKIWPRLASIEDVKYESWDVVTLSFFGLNEEILDTVLTLAEQRAFIYMHGRPDADGPIASYDDGFKFSPAEMEEYLEEREFIYKKNVIEIQFGQPFRGISDIQRFLMEYRVRIETRGTENEMQDNIEKRFADIEERIIQTNRLDYPYYLPKNISVALFIIKTK